MPAKRKAPPRHRCPVCAFPGLETPPRSGAGGGSYEICPCCGFQFGVTDDDRGITPAAWRVAWVRDGMPWRSKGIPKPRGWDARKQLGKEPPGGG
ncbi:MAG: hypothetical protein ACKVYV_11295 [Limisphaerales bacterium]